MEKVFSESISYFKLETPNITYLRRACSFYAQEVEEIKVRRSAQYFSREKITHEANRYFDFKIPRASKR